MWYALIFALMIIPVFSIFQTPKEWWQKTWLKILLIIFHTIGILSILLLLFVFHNLQDGLLRDLIVIIETVYFVLTLFISVLSIFRLLFYFFAQFFKNSNAGKKIINILKNKQLFFIIFASLGIIYLIPAIINANTLAKTEYKININKPSKTKNMRVALIADLHVGAGATEEQLDSMTRSLNEVQPDLVVIAGDITDSSSSIWDVEKLTNSLKQVRSQYGIYYIEGNHEIESNINALPYLADIGVHYLDNSSVTLPNDVNLVGISDKRDKTTSDILEQSGKDQNLPCIAVQHRPREYSKTIKNCDLVLSGHTHGYQYPFIVLTAPFRRELSHGRRDYEDKTAIVTSGVAEWGYRAKWPSFSEVVQIDLEFLPQ